MANTCLKLMKDRKQEAWGTKIRINVEHTHTHTIVKLLNLKDKT